MKVILIAPLPPPAGGIAGWTVRMQKTSLKNGWEVEIVDEKLIGNREVFSNKSKRNYLNEIKRTFNIWKDLYKALNDDSAKIVHSCIPASTNGMIREYVCAVITKVRKRSFIIHYRSTLPNMIKTKLGFLLFKMLTNISDHAIALNSLSEDFIKRQSKTPVTLIPNFIQNSEIIEKNSKKINEDIERVIYVGGVIREKGCYEIINISRKFPKIKFYLIGKAEQEIIDMKKPENCYLLGEINSEEVKKELKTADIFVFLTYFQGEGFSNALAEAMAYGLPCIVSDWAANKVMIGETGGYVVPIKDEKATEEALIEMSSNIKLRKKQSNRNISKVKENYIEEKVTDMYVDIYEQNMKGNKK